MCSLLCRLLLLLFTLFCSYSPDHIALVFFCHHLTFSSSLPSPSLFIFHTLPSLACLCHLPSPSPSSSFSTLLLSPALRGAASTPVHFFFLATRADSPVLPGSAASHLYLFLVLQYEMKLSVACKTIFLKSCPIFFSHPSLVSFMLLLSPDCCSVYS